MLSRLLLPFAVLYALLTDLRNALYRSGKLRSVRFSVPTIIVGNLRVGGTGKTPHAGYLLAGLKARGWEVAGLSRGYGRKTKGFRWVEKNASAETVGDEPLLLKQRLDVPFAVCEARVPGLVEIFREKPETQGVVLDDAYQHRSLRPHLKILLSPYDAPFYEDFVLPAGRLRERRRYAGEAGIILVTQCPANVSEEKKQEIEAKVREYNTNAPIFFTTYTHGAPYCLGKPEEKRERLPEAASLCCGIARPERFRESAESAGIEVLDFLNFKDHHNFSEADLAQIRALPSPIITTEKDAQRLCPHLELLSEVDIWVWPLEVSFLGGEERFWEEVFTHCKD